MYADGFYSRDSLFKGTSNVGTDVVTLVLAVPLLCNATLALRRGSRRGELLLLAIIAWFLYTYATYALSVAFNDLFLVYVALFSASGFVLILLIRSSDWDAVAARIADRAARNASRLLIGSGALTAIVWLLPLIDALLSSEDPRWLDTSTTMVTDALDLAIITPSALLGGVLLRRREPFGYVLAFPLIGLLVVLAPAIVAQTVSQLNAGIDYTPGEVIGPMAGFVVLGVIAVRCLIGLLAAFTQDGGQRLARDTAVSRHVR